MHVPYLHLHDALVDTPSSSPLGRWTTDSRQRTPRPHDRRTQTQHAGQSCFGSYSQRIALAFSGSTDGADEQSAHTDTRSAARRCRNLVAEGRRARPPCHQPGISASLLGRASKGNAFVRPCAFHDERCCSHGHRSSLAIPRWYRWPITGLGLVRRAKTSRKVHGHPQLVQPLPAPRGRNPCRCAGRVVLRWGGYKASVSGRS
mmetsp:Transcript_28208/g.67075  ORF Transcript_28208/g.67075 Transcript_28208/m.67075 type:complete len:203 (+) Transcript_28208:959-1567(+)